MPITSSMLEMEQRLQMDDFQCDTFYPEPIYYSSNGIKEYQLPWPDTGDTLYLIDIDTTLRKGRWLEMPVFIGKGVTQIGNTVIVSKSAADTVCCHNIDMVYSSLPPSYHCSKCDKGIDEDQYDSDMLICQQKLCDHFFVKQSITIEDTALIGQDWEWMPCICVHCKQITICK